MAGRKRKQGEREPNGRIARDFRRQLDGPAPGDVRRLRDAALRGLRDAEWGTEPGRLYLVGRLTEARYAALKRVGQVWAAYHWALGIALPRGSYAALIGVRGGTPGDDGDLDAFRKRAAVEARDALVARMRAASVHGCALAIRLATEEGVTLVGTEDELALTAALDALTSRPAHVRNRS